MLQVAVAAALQRDRALIATHVGGTVGDAIMLRQHSSWLHTAMIVWSNCIHRAGPARAFVTALDGPAAIIAVDNGFSAYSIKLMPSIAAAAAADGIAFEPLTCNSHVWHTMMLLQRSCSNAPWRPVQPAGPASCRESLGQAYHRHDACRIRVRDHAIAPCVLYNNNNNNNNQSL
jgi:hypothetical protein